MSYRGQKLKRMPKEEARVRFVRFSISHDEWVNVKKGIRERLIPVEALECHKVKVVDLVMCFQEIFDYAVYVDAHVREIQRRLHDIKGCWCIFVVHYDDGNTEGDVKTKPTSASMNMMEIDDSSSDDSDQEDEKA